MRQLVVFVFAVLITWSAVSRGQQVEKDCPQKAKNGKQPACCETAGKQCDKSKCNSEATGQTAALVAKAGCEEDAKCCASKKKGCPDKAARVAGATKTTACRAKEDCGTGKSEEKLGIVTSCETKQAGCPCKAAAKVAKSTACQATATACATKTAACSAQAKACGVVSVACPSDEACGCGTACKCSHQPPSHAEQAIHDKITHIKQAARHLHAAGLNQEAEHVLAKAIRAHHKLLEHKIAQLKRLQGEIDKLHHVAARNARVQVSVQGDLSQEPCDEQERTVIIRGPIKIRALSEQVANGQREVRILVVAVPEVAEGSASECEEEDVVEAPLAPPAPTAKAPTSTRK